MVDITESDLKGFKVLVSSSLHIKVTRDLVLDLILEKLYNSSQVGPTYLRCLYQLKFWKFDRLC